MARRLVFPDRTSLHETYARLSDQSWVESCMVDVPKLELSVVVIDNPAVRAKADNFLRRQRRRIRIRSD